MKNYSILFAILILPVTLFGQEKSIRKFYNKYKNNEEVTSIKISGTLIKVAAKFVPEEAKEAKEVIKRVTKLRVMTMDQETLKSPKEVSEFIKDVKGESFDELIKIRHHETSVNFFVRENGEAITDILVLVNDEGEFIMLSLEGKLKYSDLKYLEFDVDGGDSFKKLPKRKDDVPRA